MISVSDLRKGLKIEIDGEPYEVVDFQFVKPGKGQALYRCKIRNLVSGGTIDKTYRAADKIQKPDMHERDLTYSYADGDNFVFMDENYEQMLLGHEVIGEQKAFLVEEIEVKVLFHNNRPIEITLPNFIERTIVETEPGARGDTATNVNKSAKVQGGYEIAVPLFVNEGDTVRIDTRTGKYADRVSKGG